MRRSAIREALRRETGLARVSIGLVALHVVDDRLLQPSPGTSARDHLFGALVPTALLAAGAVLYGRARAGLRATIACAAGFLGVLGATEAPYYGMEVGPSGDDFTGLLSLGAGLSCSGSARRRSGGRGGPTAPAGCATAAGP